MSNFNKIGDNNYNKRHSNDFYNFDQYNKYNISNNDYNPLKKYFKSN